MYHCRLILETETEPGTKSSFHYLWVQVGPQVKKKKKKDTKHLNNGPFELNNGLVKLCYLEASCIQQPANQILLSVNRTDLPKGNHETEGMVVLQKYSFRTANLTKTVLISSMSSNLIFQTK